MPWFNGTFAHDSRYGKLQGNLHGSPLAAYFYNQGVKAFPRTLYIQPSDYDPCVYMKQSAKRITLLSTTIDNLLVLASDSQQIDKLL